MADQRISDMPTATDLTGTVFMPLIQNGINKKLVPSIFFVDYSLRSSIIDVTGINITLDFLGLKDFIFQSNAIIGVNKTINLFNNTSNALRFRFLFTISAGVTINFIQTNIKNRGNPEWNGSGFNLVDSGDYQIEGVYDGTNWRLKLL